MERAGGCTRTDSEKVLLVERRVFLVYVTRKSEKLIQKRSGARKIAFMSRARGRILRFISQDTIYLAGPLFRVTRVSSQVTSSEVFDDNLKICEYFPLKISDMLDYLILQHV